MKLIRFGKTGKELPGIIIDGNRYDVSGFTKDFDGPFFENHGLVKLSEYIKAHNYHLKPVPQNEPFACPVASPSKIVCIGLNYADHAKETNAQIPIEPVIFMKSTTAITGPYDNIVIPKNSNKTDWEVELAVVVGKKLRYATEKIAEEGIAGYLLHNDVSEREFQLERNGTWDKGKGCDTFAPLGPFLVTKDEIKDVNSLKLWLKVNGRVMQNGSTSNLIFKIPFLLSYISQFMTLLPGDIVSTGTPAGVGLGFDPPVYLKPEDIIELGIDGLGEQRQVVKAYATH